MTKRICLSGADMYELEEVFAGRRGIASVRTGYINAAPNAAHDDVLSGASGGRMGVEIVYDPKKIDISQLLDLHFAVVTPYSIDGQGYVRGAMCRAGVFYESAEDEPQIQLYLTFLAGKGRCPATGEHDAQRSEQQAGCTARHARDHGAADLLPGGGRGSSGLSEAPSGDRDLHRL